MKKWREPEFSDTSYKNRQTVTTMQKTKHKPNSELMKIVVYVHPLKMKYPLDIQLPTIIREDTLNGEFNSMTRKIFIVYSHFYHFSCEMFTPLFLLIKLAGALIKLGTVLTVLKELKK